LSKRTKEEQLRLLNLFETANAGTRTFNLTQSERKNIWAQLFNIVRDINPDVDNSNATPKDPTKDDRDNTLLVDLQLKALVACRILSRDKKDLNESIENADVDLMVQALVSTTDDKSWASSVIFEAKKVLSNCIQQSETVRAYSVQTNLINKVFQLIKVHKVFDECERFDLRLMFLLTATCEELRGVANQQLKSIEHLTVCLENILSSQVDSKAKVSDDHALYMGEMIKLLFNLTLEVNVDEDMENLIRLCSTLDKVLNLTYENDEGAQVAVSNVIHVLTNLHDMKEPTLAMFPVEDMTNVDRLLSFLMNKLKILDGGNSALLLKEEVSPVLMVLWGISKLHSHVRKHLKKIILPPLTAQDLKKKPEEGATPKGRLVSLLTNPDVEISMMSAELLFVLCKHNVGKMVKQTGYGHAAGLLARRGLMLGGRGEAIFSSDSEGEGDEDESYKKEAHLVNPITGRVEEVRPSPFEGMSEEQKEYEAVKMANLLHDLQKSGFIKPGTIGPDGKPLEVEHILQLQEGLNLSAADNEDADSD